MSLHDYVWGIEINTTPEKLWAALTAQPFWGQFSGPIETDWKTGSPIKYFLPEGRLYSTGKVLEANPPFLLRHTWPNPAEEQGADPVQQLTWRIESVGEGRVKLTLRHENLNDKDYQGVSGGWPSILDDVKKSLEA